MDCIKCKMCGGTIEFNPGDTIGVCDSCGTKLTLPGLDDELIDAAGEKETEISEANTKARNKKIAIICGSIVAVLIAFLVFLNFVIIPLSYLEKATAQLEEGNYDEAYVLIEKLGEYNTIKFSKYNRAVEFAQAEEYMAAYSLFVQIADYKDVDKKMVEIKPQYFKSLKKKTSVGDIVFFGEYEQDNNLLNGKENIEWRVLAKEENRLFLISEYALDCLQYNAEYSSVIWENCSLRTWLNDTFFKASFSEAEQGMIKITKVTADKDSGYSKESGKDTADKVFLLSTTEAEKYFSSNEDRKCVPTAYAVERGARAIGGFTKGDKVTCLWWLRSPGIYTNCAAVIYKSGGVYSYGFLVNYSHVCVRPALWIEI
ncbi:MAG: DUF6273 domain-containing protein [Clostridiales bacterium]|nr:DUF6273 domain-containing protein [Clostridiales bacterium]